jgi:hypothetical protein
VKNTEFDKLCAEVAKTPEGRFLVEYAISLRVAYVASVDTEDAWDRDHSLLGYKQSDDDEDEDPREWAKLHGYRR